MEAAVRALKQQKPARVMVAAPVGAPDTWRRLRGLADAVESLETPEPFRTPGLWYRNFSQTTDEEVTRLLAARRAAPAAS